MTCGFAKSLFFHERARSRTDVAILNRNSGTGKRSKTINSKIFVALKDPEINFRRNFVYRLRTLVFLFHPRWKLLNLLEMDAFK